MTVATVVADAFDPLTFLGLKLDSAADEERWRQLLWNDLASFMLQQFVDTLSDTELDEIESVLPHITEYDLALRLIQHYRPQFDQLKPLYLAAYQARFKVEDFKQKYQM